VAINNLKLNPKQVQCVPRMVAILERIMATTHETPKEEITNILHEIEVVLHDYKDGQ
jgi:hypothetical protein